MQDRRSFARTVLCGSRWPCALCCALVLALLFFGAGSVSAQPLSQRFSLAGQKKTRGETVSTTPHPAIARIIVPEKDGVSYGSGSLIDVRDDYALVVTNWHVVRDASGAISVLFPDGFSSKAEVVKVDKDWDLAALSIRKPNAAPLTMTAAPPQPGQRLFIAGYGSGDFRAAAGKCLGYGSPEQGFPQELVEVDAEARHGDSGGPILTERGEIAGVLFGTNGTTHGSYGGRVIGFLSSVLPGGNFAKTTPLPTNNIPTNSIPTTSSPPDQAFAITEPDLSRQLSAMALHPSRQLAEPPDGMLAQSKQKNGHESAEQDSALVPIPGKRVAETAVPLPADHPDQDSIASIESGRGSLSPDGSNSSPSRFSADASPISSRRADAAKTSAADEGSAVQLLVEAWKKIGGESVWDQTKAVLAIVGILALFVMFWRMNGHPDPVVQEE
ncbi:MAG: trypsin-like peptidase domain-containing protein [Pirellulaceae bacterium]